MKIRLFVAGIILSSLITNSALANGYTDVPQGVWFEEAVNAFTGDGMLDSTQDRFRPDAPATRAEFLKLVVMLNGGLLSTPPELSDFDDVAKTSWYFSYMEEAAKENWIKGDNDCYGSHPCNARPDALITRAEATTLIVRAFAFQPTGNAPVFIDNPNGQWYTDAIQTLADHCVLQGDAATGEVFPNRQMTRAEMIVLLHRVDQGLMYGVDCGVRKTEPRITRVVATSAKTLEIEFNIPIDADAAEDISHYQLQKDGSDIAISSVAILAPETIELTFAPESLTCGQVFTVNVTDLIAIEGKTFSGTADGTFYCITEEGAGMEAALSADPLPNDQPIRRNANAVTMLRVDLTSPCSDAAKIDAITLGHHGTGSVLDIAEVAAYAYGDRMAVATYDGRTELWRLKFEPAFTIPACKTVTFDFRADIPTDAQPGSDHALMIELATDIESDSREIHGNFPLLGPRFIIK